MTHICKTALFFLMILVITFSCNPKKSGNKQSAAEETTSGTISPDLSMDNLLAWCIVPFDARERGPEERIEMLRDLGFTQYAWDWRTKHLPEMADEIRLAREHDIDMMAVWMWIDANTDTVGAISEANEQILTTLETTGLQTQIWLGIHANFFEGLDEEQSIEKGIAMVEYLAERASGMDCHLALYNHGDWFGDPVNQVKILRRIDNPGIGIIYNFHHAHDQIDRLPELIETMKPWLWVVNLNGMKKGGPKILPVGQGDHEKEMILQFLTAGFNGPWGILGHVEERDVKEVLQENLEGLRKIFPERN